MCDFVFPHSNHELAFDMETELGEHAGSFANGRIDNRE